MRNTFCRLIAATLRCKKAVALAIAVLCPKVQHIKLRFVRLTLYRNRRSMYEDFVCCCLFIRKVQCSGSVKFFHGSGSSDL
jgi:hypothetical protein